MAVHGGDGDRYRLALRHRQAEEALEASRVDCDERHDGVAFSVSLNQLT